MSKRVWLLLAVLLPIILLLIWLAYLRPLTEPHALVQAVKTQVEDATDIEFHAVTAIWKITSPFDITLSGVELTQPSRPGQAIFISSVRLNLRSSALLNVSPRMEVESMDFRDLGFASSTHSYAEEPRPGEGLTGEIRREIGDDGGQVWHLELEGQNLGAQPILDFLGARFELESSLDVQGTLAASGSELETLKRTLTGEISLSGGPGHLDARAIDTLNRGVVRWARDSGHFVDWPDIMDFERLEASFEVLRGIDETRFSFVFGNMSLQGNGGIDFFERYIDYHFELQFASGERLGTFQAGEYMADVPWPIRCRGFFEERLPCGLDRDALAELALKLIERDAKDRLSSTFGEVLQESGEALRDERP